MLLKVALFAMLAIGVIGGAAIAWVVLGVSPDTATAASPVPRSVQTQILVAARSLRAGSLIKPEDLAAQEVPSASVPAGATVDHPQGRGSLTGAMIRRSLSEGQAILPADVVHPGDHGFLAAVLGPNMRAITVPVDDVSATAGLIWPGDRVDVILTQALEDPALAAGRRIAAETVLSDARVIAVDQQIVQGQAPDGATAPANRTATLEVTSSQAERVLVAGRLGKLSLSVLSADRYVGPAPVAVANRDVMSPATGKIPEPAAPGRPNDLPPSGKAKMSVTWAGDVSPALGNSETRAPPVMVHVFPGGSDSKEFHF